MGIADFHSSENLKLIYDNAVYMTLASRPGVLRHLAERGTSTELQGSLGASWFETAFTKAIGSAAGFARSTSSASTDGSLSYLGRTFGDPVKLRHKATFFWTRALMELHKLADYQVTGNRGHFVDEAATRLAYMGQQAVDFMEGLISSPYSGRYVARVMASGSALTDGGAAGSVSVNPAQNLPREGFLEVYDSGGSQRSGVILEVIQTNNSMDTATVSLKNVATAIAGSGSNYTPTEGDYLVPYNGTSTSQNFLISLDAIVSADAYPPSYASGGLSQVDDETFRAYVLAGDGGSGNAVPLNPRMIRHFMVNLASQSSAYRSYEPIQFRSLAGMTSQGNPWSLVMRPEHYNALMLDAEPKRRYMDNPSRVIEPGMLVMDTVVDGYYYLLDQRLPATTVYALCYPSFVVVPPRSVLQSNGDILGFRQIPEKSYAEAMSLYVCAFGARHRNSLGKITGVRGMTAAEAGIPS